MNAKEWTDGALVVGAEQPEDDPRVVAALKEYMAAWEAGAGLDRQAWLARHPEVAAELSEYIDGLEFIQAAAPQLWNGPGPVLDALPRSEGETTQQIGDYRVIQEIGRGGMGAVYEAEQVSLRRRVALKVLPFASALDPKQLQRFQNEAHAAAQLHHPNIVPIHAVGCEHGVHYYAMQFIEGRSLADLLADFRREARRKSGKRTDPNTTPASAVVARRFRRAAELIAEAAQALDHAHQVGVIHRDIKPANLLVDCSGRLWVTDFGLALLQNNPVLTATGELVGTLRYMSPEQSLGRRGALDHRADVYSLGVTLYELLTLKPAFDGQDIRDLLNQLATAEPKPPRRIEPRIPRDLETVVLKAIAKNPTERYATAQEMADDLRRFLTDEPVRARRPTLPDRAAKWARRHRTVVGSALALLGTTVLALIVGMVFVTREHVATKTALKRERVQAREARAQHARAEESFRQARAVVDYFTKVSSEDLANLPPFALGVRRRMLETSLLYYRGFLDQRPDDPALQAELSACRARVSKILEELYALEATGKVLLATEPAVQADLQMSEEQRSRIRSLADQASRQTRAALQGQPEEGLASVRADEEAVAAVLTSEQTRRLDQIILQKRMIYGSCDPRVLEALRLTDEQKAAVRSIHQEVRLSLWTEARHDDLHGSRPSPQDVWRVTSAKILEVLDDGQRATWKDLMGEPFQGRHRSAVVE